MHRHSASSCLHRDAYAKIGLSAEGDYSAPFRAILQSVFVAPEATGFGWQAHLERSRRIDAGSPWVSTAGRTLFWWFGA